MAIRVFVVDPFVVIRIIRYVTDYTELGLKYLFETETTTLRKQITYFRRMKVSGESNTYVGKDEFATKFGISRL